MRISSQLKEKLKMLLENLLSVQLSFPFSESVFITANTRLQHQIMSKYDEWPTQTPTQPHSHTLMKVTWPAIVWHSILNIQKLIPICDLYAFVVKTDINCSENGPIEHLTLKWITHLWQELKVNRMNVHREIDPFQLAECLALVSWKRHRKRAKTLHIYDYIDVL